MKKIMKVALAAMMMLAPKAANAQLNLGNIAGALLGGSDAASTVTDVVTNLIGNKKISDKNLVGTWTYSEPCVVMESENVLSNMGGTVLANKIEQQEKKALEKVGFKAGKVVLTLNQDKSGTITVGKRTTNVTWDVNESNLQLTYLTRTISINAKLSGGDLQLAMNADKLLNLVSSTASAASSLSSSFGIISNLISSYDGLYLGLKFTKK